MSMLSTKIHPMTLAVANLLISTSLVLQNVKTSKDNGGRIDGPLFISAILYFLSFVLRIILTVQSSGDENSGMNCGMFQLSNLINIMAYTIVIGFKITNLNKVKDELAKMEKDKQIDPENFNEKEEISEISMGSYMTLLFAYLLYIVFCSLTLYITYKSDMNSPQKINYTITSLILLICIAVFIMIIIQRSKKNKISNSKLSISIDSITIVMFILLITLLVRFQTMTTECHTVGPFKFKQ